MLIANKSKKSVEVNPDMIGKYVNRHLYSDIIPSGKIIGISGKHTLILAKVHHELDPNWKPETVIGGFSGITLNNHSQSYTYTVDESDTFKIRWSQKAIKSGIRIEDSPIYFYDYNF